MIHEHAREACTSTTTIDKSAAWYRVFQIFQTYISGYCPSELVVQLVHERCFQHLSIFAMLGLFHVRLGLVCAELGMICAKLGLVFAMLGLSSRSAYRWTVNATECLLHTSAEHL